MKWYYTRFGVATIEVVEIEKETKAFVFINGRRNAKSSEYDCYRPTWEEAYAELIKEHRRRVDKAVTLLNLRQRGLKQAQRLKER